MNNSSATTTVNQGDLQQEERIIVVTVYSVFFLISFIGNSLVLITIVGNRKLRNITSVLLANLALNDLILSLVLVPNVILNAAGIDWCVTNWLCTAFGISLLFFFNTSIYCTAVIAFDRYMAIVHCLRYSSWSQHRYIGVLLLVLYATCLVNTALPLLFGWTRVQKHEGSLMYFVELDASNGYNVYLTITLFVLPLIVMMTCYGLIIKVAKIHARKIGDIQSQINKNKVKNVATNGLVAFAVLDPVRRLSVLGIPGGSSVVRDKVFMDPDCISVSSTNALGQKSAKRRRRECWAMLRLPGLAFIFMCCWGPMTYLNFLGSTSDSSFKQILHIVSVIFVGLHPTLDPFIYALFSRPFRNASLRFLGIRSQNPNLDDDDRVDINGRCFQTNGGTRVKMLTSMFSTKIKYPHNVLNVSSLAEVSENYCASELGEMSFQHTSNSTPKSSFKNNNSSSCEQKHCHELVQNIKPGNTHAIVSGINGGEIYNQNPFKSACSQEMVSKKASFSSTTFINQSMEATGPSATVKLKIEMKVAN